MPARRGKTDGGRGGKVPSSPPPPSPPRGAGAALGASGVPAAGGGGGAQGRDPRRGVPLPASRGRAGRSGSRGGARRLTPSWPLSLPQARGVRKSPRTAAPAAAPLPAEGRGGAGRRGCPGRRRGAASSPLCRSFDPSRPVAASREELEGNNRKRGGEQQLQKHQNHQAPGPAAGVAPRARKMRRAGGGSAPRLSEVRLGEPRPRTAPHRAAARRGRPGRSPGPPRSASAAGRLSARPPGAPEGEEARRGGCTRPRRARLGAASGGGGAGRERCAVATEAEQERAGSRAGPELGSSAASRAHGPRTSCFAPLRLYFNDSACSFPV